MLREAIIDDKILYVESHGRDSREFHWRGRHVHSSEFKTGLEKAHPGIDGLKLRELSVMVYKAPAYSWKEIEPAILSKLSHLSCDRSEVPPLEEINAGM